MQRRVIVSLDQLPRPCVIATGPLTGDRLASELRAHFGSEFLYFFDAIAPIVDADSIDTTIAWKADRWDKGTKDYFNCPLSKEQYFTFIDGIQAAKKIESKEFEKNTPFFESCMPIEAILERGTHTLRFGPMKPKGLPDPRTGKEPYAAVQLRQDNQEATAYSMVGFQTKMSYGDQKTVFRMIPGLQNAEFLKLGKHASQLVRQLSAVSQPRPLQPQKTHSYFLQVKSPEWKAILNRPALALWWRVSSIAR